MRSLRLAEVFLRLVGHGVRVRFHAYDESTAGPQDAGVAINVRSLDAIRYLVGSPGDLGISRAYVAGEIEVEGDLYTALRELSSASTSQLSGRDRIAILRALGPGALCPLRRLPEEVRLRGRRHSMGRDRAAISHHYDVSDRFYGWVLGPSRAYTCAVYPRQDACLEEAQFEKFDLACRKLGLRPGMRLLDVGCGWGGMVMHAAQHYGVTALGVTLSQSQAQWAQKAVADAGLGDIVEVRHQDYRDVSEEGFDAISSIGLTEHIGARRLPSYFRLLRSRLRPRGRLLNHCITRPTNTERTFQRRGFINRFVFPDGELEGAGHIISVMQDSGFELRHTENLREHYVRTLAAWSRNLDAHWDEAVQEVGERKARVWALYMAGSRLAFERNHIQLHQVLGVKTEGGDAAMPLRPDWEGPPSQKAPRRVGRHPPTNPTPRVPTRTQPDLP